jgi:putative resolvase
MKLSAWAKKNSISYRSAHRLFKAGKIPFRTQQLVTGTILVHEDEPIYTNSPRKWVLYAAATSDEHVGTLDGQLEKLQLFAAAKGISYIREVREVSGKPGATREELGQLLDDPAINLIVESRQRIGVDVDAILKLLKACNREILFLKADEGPVAIERTPLADQGGSV